MSLLKTKYKILIQRNKDRIFNYALYMVKNRLDAEDISQEVMIRIWENINSFKVRSSSAYIMRITHNLCIDLLRVRKSREMKTMTIDDFYENENRFGFTESPEQAVHVDLMVDNIKKIIRDLPENLKSPIIMYEINGMKYKEISAVLDIPLNTIKVNILRARKKIQEKLHHYEKHEVL